MHRRITRRSVWARTIGGFAVFAAAVGLLFASDVQALAAPANNPGTYGSAAGLYSRVGWDTSDYAVDINSSGVLIGNNNGANNGAQAFYGQFLGASSNFLLIVGGNSPYAGDCVFFGFGHYYVKGCIFNHGNTVLSEVWNSSSTAMWSQLFNLYQAGTASIVWAGVGRQITYGPPNGMADNQHWYFNCGITC